MKDTERLQLIEKFESGNLSQEDLDRIEQLILDGDLDPMEFSSIASTAADVSELKFPTPTMRMDEGFYASIRNKRRSVPSISERLASWVQPGWKLAFYSLLLVVLGYLGRPLIQQNGNEELITEVRHMKELMMLTLIEEESTSDRLKAVNMTEEISDASSDVIDALFATLNNDPNTNVRLASLEALLRYTDRPEVRMGLVESISIQDSPMLQISLAEVMAGLQEKSSVKDLQKLLERDETPAEVKEKVKETIETLI